MPVTNHPYHVVFLRAELVRRTSKNPNYSLRAFARALSLHPSALSRILQGKQDLTVKACGLIVPKIVLTDDEKHDFLLSVVEEKMHRAAEVLTKALGVQIRLPQRSSAIAS